ncbi:class I SAM-dependent methyltransferase [Roseiconus nitratireducens]|uniref:Class I SAM-dependent methyltransferase n=1 Tax=Roseiconus nitratireducens TaxID=2605748 RepID=A0A5M6D7X2_9BACT|nr:class I SAM-dependent methyltransferase [Roseiconus nitratireducens]KAA5543631.1 class I SAM-dependent methyltransferase [Roseiconus nitratireducens]
MQSDYALQYRRLYNQHWWWRSRESVILSILDRYAAGRTDLRILDVGCGDGLFFDALLRFGDVQGVEKDPTIVDPIGPHRSRIHVGPFEASFRPQQPFSAVLMLDVLEHLDDPWTALRHALTLLRDDGLMVITVPAFNELWTQHDDINHHRIRYTKRSFGKLAEECSLRVDRCEYFFHWVAAAKLGVRLKEKIRPTDPRPAEVPPAAVNQLLRWGSEIERRLFGWMKLPFGSSLLVVGGK